MTNGVASRKAEADAASVLLVGRLLWKPLRRELKLLMACIEGPWQKRGDRRATQEDLEKGSHRSLLTSATAG